jgi:hypothetical protein
MARTIDWATTEARFVRRMGHLNRAFFGLGQIGDAATKLEVALKS